ncbi:MAG TPA: hypothetical protein VG276_30855 [Actinomycetes bacterium]|nr:hypothetical protein [Actinomycetes bacterium]
MSRLRGRMLWLAALVVAALVLLAPFSDVIVAVLLGVGVLVGGSMLFRGLAGNRGAAAPGPPTDVVETGTLLVFACETCGEQLVLLRKGTDAPPRHCAEKMVLRRVPTPDRTTRPARPANLPDG